MTDDARLARWTAPLAAPAPEPRQHPLFELVRSEIAKLESPTAGPTDWSAVLSAADRFSTEVGRDVLVAAALASALAHREGPLGAAIGVDLLSRLVADPTVAPHRPRARSNAITSFLARLDPIVDATKDGPRAALEALEAALRGLRAATDAWKEDAPAIGPTQDRVRRALAALPAPAALVPEPVRSVFVQPPPATTSAVTTDAATGLPDRADQVPTFVRRASTQIVSAAGLVRATSMLDPDALRWTLVALYLPITSAPETTKDARTALSAPPKLVLEGLEKRAATAPPESIVKETIGALERSRFALDLHVHLARALDRAGAGAAASIHRHEVAGLLTRLPELLDREFSDGTSFASPAARTFFMSWSAKATTSELAPSAVEPAATSVDAIDALAREGRTADALALGSQLRLGAADGRDRFVATLASVRVAEAARAVPVAVDLVAALLEEVDRHGLESWEPALAGQVLRAAIRLGNGGDPASRALFARLSRIDARAAMELSASIHATPAKHGR